MALREGSANAIKHGNRQDVGKHVHLEMDVVGDTLVIAIRDEGAGSIRRRSEIRSRRRIASRRRAAGSSTCARSWTTCASQRHAAGGMEIV
jgi:anti-sigma regulatory factor (Ser/Thr protein kinase)